MPLKLSLIIEFLVICVAVPTVIIVFRLAPYMFFFLWGTTIYCLLTFPQRTGFKEVWNASAVNWINLKPMLWRFGISCMGLVLIVTLYDPGRSFEIVLHNPELWLTIMLFYPVLSALPQEFIFCNYFFARYRPLFPDERHMVWASTIVFAYVHVLFINPIAPLLSLIGGYFFATTFAKHRSLALVTIEHALYGNALFTVGLGWYFWGGAVQ